MTGNEVFGIVWFGICIMIIWVMTYGVYLVAPWPFALMIGGGSAFLTYQIIRLWFHKDER